nr:protein root hair defective 3 [Tanacetum cinerariifolium]
MLHKNQLEVNSEGLITVEPFAILDRMLARKENGALCIVHVLVHWTNGEVADATWEPYDEIATRQGDDTFNIRGFDSFMKRVITAECALSDGVVAIMGPQTSVSVAGIQGYYCLQQKLMLSSSRVTTADRVSIVGWIKIEMA